MPRTIAASLAVLAFSLACSNQRPIGPSGPLTDPIPPQTDPPILEERVLVGAGDIGWCGLPGAAATARLIEGIPGTVFTVGDNAYMRGTAREFAECYEPFWGRFKNRTFPSPGNHEYETAGAMPYFSYFGANAGPPGRGYYSYELGAWHIVSLNSEPEPRFSRGAHTAQLAWLRDDLTVNAGTACTAAYFHHPLYTSGPNHPQTHMREVYRTLYDFNVDVIVAAHDHLYERFAPQDAEGRLDLTRGIRQFVVGTGGATPYQIGRRAPNSEAIANAHGVLKLTLRANEYLWQFVAVPGDPVSDSGQERCH
ncbi:MAG: metallophosphoesterase family protein [Vicinamibacterales bacterium]